MKKFAIIASIISVSAVIFGNMTASYWSFNQPKTPSMLSK